jgi:hypothetical protein
MDHYIKSYPKEMEQLDKKEHERRTEDNHRERTMRMNQLRDKKRKKEKRNKMLNYYYHIRAIWGHYCIDHYDRIKS